MKKTLVLSVISLLIIGLLLLSCDLLGPKYPYTFQNDTDHTVEVQPAEQTTWEEFALEPDTEVIVEIPEDSILYTYTPAATTGADTGTEGIIRFFTVNIFEFRNDSDYELAISPNGQTSWETFSLGPGETKTVSIPESLILFTYDEADFIRIDTNTPGKIRVYNKTLLAIQNSSSLDIELVQWNSQFWGLDPIWDSSISQWVNGIYSGNGYYREVTPGADYISFWFPGGGPQYRTSALVGISAEEQLVFTFYDSTMIVARGISLYSQDIEDAVPVTGTGAAERMSDNEKAGEEAAGIYLSGGEING